MYATGWEWVRRRFSALGVTVNAEANEDQAPTKPAQTEVTDKSGKRLAAGAEIA